MDFEPDHRLVLRPDVRRNGRRFGHHKEPRVGSGAIMQDFRVTGWVLRSERVARSQPAGLRPLFQGLPENCATRFGDLTPGTGEIRAF